MKNRARLRVLCLSFAALLGSPAVVAQQAWPSRPVRLIVPSQAGGILDVVHRAIAAQLTESLGQPFVVENRAGAGGMLGSSVVAKAEPDGYILGVIVTGHAIHPAVKAKLPYHPVRDFEFVGQTVNLTAMLVAQPGFPANTIQQLIDLAKSKRVDITYGSAGIGQSNHLSGVLLGQRAGIDLRHVPYQGNAPALNDLLGGNIPVMFLDVLAAKPLIAAGKLKALAVTGQKRSPAAPEVPLVREAIAGFDGSSWQGIVAPAGTPKEIVRRLSAEIARLVRRPEFHDPYAANGVELVGSSPEQFATFVEGEIARWQLVASTAGMTPE